MISRVLSYASRYSLSSANPSFFYSDSRTQVMKTTEICTVGKSVPPSRFLSDFSKDFRSILKIPDSCCQNPAGSRRIDRFKWSGKVSQHACSRKPIGARCAPLSVFIPDVDREFASKKTPESLKLSRIDRLLKLRKFECRFDRQEAGSADSDRPPRRRHRRLGSMTRSRSTDGASVHPDSDNPLPSCFELEVVGRPQEAKATHPSHRTRTLYGFLIQRRRNSLEGSVGYRNLFDRPERVTRLSNRRMSSCT